MTKNKIKQTNKGGSTLGKEKELRLLAEQIRVAALEEFAALGFGHVGGAMSLVETLAVLYGGAMRVDPAQPAWAERDRLVVSKGHAGPAVYATLALKGYFPREELLTLNKPGTRLPSHCDRLKTPGIDMTTGSLGQGMSTACGLALGQRMDGTGARTFLILGDGECDEGQVWEGALFAPHHKLDNLIAFCDNNGQQLDGYVKNVLDTGDITAKFAAFGWYAQTVDGHDVEALDAAVTRALAWKGAPSMIVLKTVKGKGCPFVEGREFNHHVQFTKEEMDEALAGARAVLKAAEAAVRGGAQA
ncbi:MAG: transketolase [Oscillospiraceae bacterium]|jgi:transketolase|nr:transketolase [Oscillospiraceae bacterium]